MKFIAKQKEPAEFREWKELACADWHPDWDNLAGVPYGRSVPVCPRRIKGLLVNFLSHPVVNGFTNAAAVIIASSQLSKLFASYLEDQISDRRMAKKELRHIIIVSNGINDIDIDASGEESLSLIVDSSTDRREREYPNAQTFRCLENGGGGFPPDCRSENGPGQGRA